MTRQEFDGGWKTLQGVGWPGGEKRDPEVYFGNLGDLDSRQWSRSVAGSIDGCEYFPVPKILRELAGAVPALSVEAASAFEQVCSATVHRLLHQGQSWCSCTEDRYDVHLIRERLGDGAADAFLAAGGAAAISRRTEGDPFLLQRFSAAYAEAVKVNPAAAVRLLPAPTLRPVLALPPPLSRDEAKAAADKIAKLAGEPLPPEERPAGGTVVATDERLAELRRQAAQLLTDEPIVAQGGAQEAEGALCAEAGMPGGRG